MPDLRLASLETRRALAAEAERLARAGLAPVEIRARLGVSKRAYSNWAKLHGFRQGDLHPERPRAGASVACPAGPGGYAGSGQQLLGLEVPDSDPRRVSGPDHPAWRGGEAASRSRYGASRLTARTELARTVAVMTDADVLAAVRTALAEGDLARVDAWLMSWRGKLRRARSIAALEIFVQGFAEADRPIGQSGQPMRTLVEIAAMSDADLAAYVDSLAAEPRGETNT